MKKIVFALVAILMCVAIIAVGQETKIEKVPPKYVPANNSQQMYTEYCASCHGVDLKGNGPAAAAFKTGVPDLTTWTKRNAGTFDAQKMADIIDGTMEVPGHGSQDMPVWGKALRSVYPNKAVNNMAIDNLAQFIKERQVQ